MASGVYIHIPFCRSRCSYCDFATDVYVGLEPVTTYVDALCLEIRSDPADGVDIDTIYFGGGTPSLLSARQIDRILGEVRKKFRVGPRAEITLEMNPGTVTPEGLKAYRELGINRASFGVQTFNEHDLRLLARGHTVKDSRDTFEMLRNAGFANISLDLIAGLPGQTITDWEFNLTQAIDLGPEHLSLYLLEIHEGTPLNVQIKSGRRPMPDSEVAAEMYEVMIDTVTAAGYEQYEISNFAKEGFISQHNSKYWTLDPVRGFGVSAHSFDGVDRYSNRRDTREYVDAINGESSAEVMREMIDRESEYIFLGLRLTQGIDLRIFEKLFGHALEIKYSEQLVRLHEDELVETRHGRLKLTRKGTLYSNEVFAEFI